MGCKTHMGPLLHAASNTITTTATIVMGIPSLADDAENEVVRVIGNADLIGVPVDRRLAFSLADKDRRVGNGQRTPAKTQAVGIHHHRRCGAGHDY
jgi:hypothetical protein